MQRHLLFPIAMLSFAAPLHAQYDAQTLDPLPGYSQSVANQSCDNIVVGASFIVPDEPIPTIWIDGRPTRLHQTARPWATATGIANGRVIGDAWIEYGPSNVNAALVWTDKKDASLLEPIAGHGTHALARAIADDGQTAVGWSSVSRSVNSVVHATRWTGGEFEDLGSLASEHLDDQRHSLAYGVNGDGSIIVGQSQIDDPRAYGRAFVWTAESGIVELPQPGTGPTTHDRVVSIAYDVSDRGWISGQSTTTDSSEFWAAAWHAETRQAIALSPRGGALGVGPRGTIVGYRWIEGEGSNAMVWHVDAKSLSVRAVNLNNAVDQWNGLTGTICTAMDMEPSGTITANVLTADGYRGVLLTRNGR